MNKRKDISVSDNTTSIAMTAVIDWLALGFQIVGGCVVSDAVTFHVTNNTSGR